MNTNYLFPAKIISLLEHIKNSENYESSVKETKDMVVDMLEDDNDRLSLRNYALVELVKQEINEDNFRLRLVIPKNLTVQSLENNNLLEVYIANKNSFKTVVYQYHKLSPMLSLALESALKDLLLKGHNINIKE